MSIPDSGTQYAHYGPAASFRPLFQESSGPLFSVLFKHRILSNAACHDRRPIRYLAQSPQRQYVIWIFVLAPMVLGLSQLCFYMDRAKPALWIQIIAACAVFAGLALFIVLPGRMVKQSANKNGFQCPVCGNKITVYAGLAGWPHRNLCARCGTKVIESNGPNIIPKTEKPV